MTKRKPVRKSKPISASKGKPKSVDSRRPAGSKPRTNSNSKQADILGMLRQPQGATIPAIVKATGWQPHSVRGFFAGVVRKKLGLTMESEKPEEGDRIYRIGRDQPSEPKNRSEKLNRQAA